VITWVDVVNCEPQASGVPLASQIAILADAPIELDADAWGTKINLAWTFYCAHRALLYLQGVAGASGQIESEKVGDVERKYAITQNTTGSGWNETKWGRELLRLREGTLNCRLPLL
jgi:hypothetical protein